MSKSTKSTVKNIRWTASNMVSGTEPCVRTAQGWTDVDGMVYGCGVSPTLFGWPPKPISERVMRRVRKALGR